MRVGVVGCGLIGGKRAAALSGDDKLVATFDLVPQRAKALAQKYEAEAVDSLDALVAKSDVVVVSATNDQLVPLSTVAVKAGKHVVVEKPAGRRASELEPLAKMAADKKVVVKVGYNHRFHPAAQKARAILDGGTCGDVMFIRGRYGHGGRVGYDKEWRADPEKSGGGELIDQGVHLIDLSRWFLDGDFVDVQGRVETFFWKMPVDDNAFMTLGTAKKQVAHLQVSCTEWKNLFSLEIYARFAKLHWEGLGGSYGPERLTHYKMTPEMGPPDADAYEYAPADKSWALEWADLKRAIASGKRPCGDVVAALEALRVVDRVYGR
jgi:predicted dehydrogenase